MIAAALLALACSARAETDVRQLYDGHRPRGGEPAVEAVDAPAVASYASKNKYVYVAQAAPAPAVQPPPPAAPPSPRSAEAEPPQEERVGFWQGFKNGAKWGAGAGTAVFALGVALATPLLVIPVLGWILGIMIIVAMTGLAVIVGTAMALLGGLFGMLTRKKAS